MLCVLCKGSLVPKKVEEEVRSGDDHILVAVDAEVCENCHERYFPEGTADYLQKIKRDLKTCQTDFKPVGQVWQIP